MGFIIKMVTVLVKVPGIPTVSLEEPGDLDAQSFGERMKVARMNAGVSQGEWARMLARQPQTISNWETGRALPPLEALWKYSAILGVDLHWMLTGRPYTDTAAYQAVLKILAPNPQDGL